MLKRLELIQANAAALPDDFVKGVVVNVSYQNRNAPCSPQEKWPLLEVSPIRRKDRSLRVLIATSPLRMMRCGEAGFWFRGWGAKEEAVPRTSLRKPTTLRETADPDWDNGSGSGRLNFLAPALGCGSAPSVGFVVPVVRNDCCSAPPSPDSLVVLVPTRTPSPTVAPSGADDSRRFPPHGIAPVGSSM